MIGYRWITRVPYSDGWWVWGYKNLPSKGELVFGEVDGIRLVKSVPQSDIVETIDNE